MMKLLNYHEFLNIDSKGRLGSISMSIYDILYITPYICLDFEKKYSVIFVNVLNCLIFVCPYDYLSLDFMDFIVLVQWLDLVDF